VSNGKARRSDFAVPNDNGSLDDWIAAPVWRGDAHTAACHDISIRRLRGGSDHQERRERKAGDVLLARERSATRPSRARGVMIFGLCYAIADRGHWNNPVACDEGRQAFTPPCGPLSLLDVIQAVALAARASARISGDPRGG